MHEVGHAGLDQRPDIGRTGRRSDEPVGGRVEPGEHFHVAAVVQRPSAAGEHLVDDDAERPDVGERRPAALGRVGDDLGSHPAQRDDATVTDVEVFVGVHVTTQTRQRYLHARQHHSGVILLLQRFQRQTLATIVTYRHENQSAWELKTRQSVARSTVHGGLRRLRRKTGQYVFMITLLYAFSV